jgi:hypothetical protein
MLGLELGLGLGLQLNQQDEATGAALSLGIWPASRNLKAGAQI